MPDLSEFWIFLLVGFGAQLIDGSLGGIAGAFFLTQVSGKTIRPYVFGYLLVMGLLILWRCWREGRERHVIPGGFVAPLGSIGGFLDAVGGGGWGPVVTSSLIGAGAKPRLVIGTVNADQVRVTVNGIAARVLNRAYLAEGIPLVSGSNTIVVTATDAAGNASSASEWIHFESSGSSDKDPDLVKKLKGQCLTTLVAKYLRDDGEPGKKVNARVVGVIPRGIRLRIIEIDDVGKDDKSQNQYPVIWARVVALAD